MYCCEYVVNSFWYMSSWMQSVCENSCSWLLTIFFSFIIPTSIMAHNIHVFILFNTLVSRIHSLSWQWVSALFHLSFAYSMYVIIDSVVLLSIDTSWVLWWARIYSFCLFQGNTVLWLIWSPNALPLEISIHKVFSWSLWPSDHHVSHSITSLTISLNLFTTKLLPQSCGQKKPQVSPMIGTSLMTLTVKNLPAELENWVQSLGLENLLDLQLLHFLDLAPGSSALLRDDRKCRWQIGF